MESTISDSDHDKQLLAHLGEQPGWNALRELVKQKMEEVFGLTARELMRGTEVSREVVEYRRGFFAGMKFLLDQPTLEAEALKKALAEERKDDQ